VFVPVIDLKTQLKNAAFGDSSSEEILRVSELKAALKVITNAADTCTEIDVRTDELKVACGVQDRKRPSVEGAAFIHGLE